MTEPTVAQQKTKVHKPWQFKPGQSGNAAGRPIGSRNRLADAFLQALHTSFEQRGIEAIERVIAEEPAQYLKVIASLMPKELKVANAELDGLSDDDVNELVNHVRTERVRQDRIQRASEQEPMKAD